MALDRKTLRPYSSNRAGQAFSPVGIWENELGSSMEIKTFDGINFSGTYKSAVSENGSSVGGELAGTVAGDAVAFFVNWRSQYSSVTGWSGLILVSGVAQAIYALWNLASTPESPAEVWESIQAGADLFVKLS